MRAEAIAWTGYNDEGEVVSDFINIESYPSGEPLVRFPHPDNWWITEILLRPKNMTEFLGGMFFVDAYVDRGHTVPNLILPFPPGSRQDRRNDEGDYLFTAKSVAAMVNARKFPQVTILDPHSDVIAGLIDNCKVIHAVDCLAKDPNFNANDYDCVVSPDAGSEKRAGAVAKRYGKPLVHGWKTRDVTTGAITGFGFEDVRDQNYRRGLVVDDICDGGGTFVGMAPTLFKQIECADLYVTHGLFTRGTQSLLDHYGKVICTDSVTAQRPGVSIIEICKDLLVA